MKLDKFKLMNDEIPILERLDIFISETENLGYNPDAISQGTLDEHLLSNAFEVPPQIIRMFFELYLCNEGDRNFLSKKKLDTGIIRTLMLIEDDIREVVYEYLDELLKEEFPVSKIIEFINNGRWRTRIETVYEEVDRSYWATVSSYLKDMNIVGGTITIRFRSLLMNIMKYETASKKQLEWLERGIIHDDAKNLDIFTNNAMRKNYPDAVKWIEKYLSDYKNFDL